MKWIGTLFLTLMLLSPAFAAQEEPVWFWFSTCGGPSLTLNVELDQKVIYTSSFPLCRAERSSIHSEGQKTNLHFSFTSSRPIVWTGYRDEDTASAPNQVIQGDIWLAGADPDDLVLGVSFSTDDTIYMNTVHVAYPDRSSQTEIASGLTVLTTPGIQL